MPKYRINEMGAGLAYPNFLGNLLDPSCQGKSALSRSRIVPDRVLRLVSKFELHYSYSSTPPEIEMGTLGY